VIFVLQRQKLNHEGHEGSHEGDGQRKVVF